MANTMLLETEAISKSFGGIHAIRDLDISIHAGEIVGIIGPNGSGKTTFFNILSGLYRPTSGTIKFKGRDIANVAVHKIVKRGITRTFQNLRVFRDISVLENVLIGRHHLIDTSLFNIYFRPFLVRKQEKNAYLKAIELLRLVHLEDEKHELARNLPYGQQRLLEIARSLIAEPDLLLLDEPTAGMNPTEVAALCLFLEEVRGRGFTLFIIEHNMKAIMSVADRIIVLNAGTKIKEGSPKDVQSDKQVQEIYLGEAD